LNNRVLLLTGPPAIGKTTVLSKTAVALNAKGYHVGGMISREIRQNHERLGFEIIDLTTTEHSWLAHISQREGPQIGKYKINLENLDKIGAQAIYTAMETCEIIIIDEIGPMELFSENFKHAVNTALNSKKLVIAAIHWRTQDSLIHEARNREDAETIIITFENRGSLSEQIVEKCLTMIKPQL
jgi:nucleoside-triphosphatase